MLQQIFNDMIKQDVKPFLNLIYMFNFQKSAGNAAECHFRARMGEIVESVPRSILDQASCILQSEDRGSLLQSGKRSNALIQIDGQRPPERFLYLLPVGVRVVTKR
ncbi:hypothetical protein E8L90_08535 [Brevibacillus antibioticus]|uniref:Uncharacterized protein n=1 Tax=Brevibacillus antibioticus TaxID=2570228 RepID=A0A4U2Y4V2_9BACL|nr:hypothetical protein E8L90_08535 [Brevibacillus antibioticus]